MLPAKLTRALKKYCLDIGLTAFARNFILSEENNIEPDGFRLVTLGDGNVWYAQRPAKKWQSDMHWISPADEKGHESYLKLLNENGFLSVLNVIGNWLHINLRLLLFHTVNKASSTMIPMILEIALSM